MEEKGDMEELRRLFSYIKEQTLEMDECKSSPCIIKPRYYKLLQVALKLVKESDLLIKEKNGAMHHKNLVIQQYQIQKRRMTTRSSVIE